MQIRLTLLLILTALGGPVTAQQIRESHGVVHDNLGTIDDIVVTPTGETYLSFPSQGFVGRETMTPQGVVWTPVAFGLVLAMALEPSASALWISEFGNGVVSRVDLASGQVTQTLNGFGHPIDLVFRDANTLIVGGMDIPDPINGIGTVYQVDLAAPGGPATTALATGFPGALDMEYNAQGRLFVVSLLSPDLKEVDLVSGAVSTIATGLLQATDMIKGPGNTLFVTTLVAGEVLRVDPDPTTPSIWQLAALMGEVAGVGCEDMDYDLQGDLLITLTNGEIRRLILNNGVVQEGTALGGFSFNLVVSDPAHAGWIYQLVASFATASIPLFGSTQVLPVAIDLLFQQSIDPTSVFFTGFGGILDASGGAVGSVHIPVLPTGTLLTTYFGVLILDITGPFLLIEVPDFLEIPIFTL